MAISSPSKSRIILMMGTIAFLLGAMLIFIGQTTRSMRAYETTEVRGTVAWPQSGTLPNRNPMTDASKGSTSVVATRTDNTIRITKERKSVSLPDEEDSSTLQSGEEDMTHVQLVDTRVVDTPSTIMMAESARLVRYRATSRTDFPQYDRDRFIEAIRQAQSTTTEEGRRMFHPSLVAWAGVRYKVAEIPFSQPDSKVTYNRHLRYPVGPPGLYQYYSSIVEINTLFAPYSEWKHAAPEEREVWGRWGPSADGAGKRSQDVTPPILDYAHIRCPKEISAEGGSKSGGLPLGARSVIRSSVFATLLGRTRISAVVEDAALCLMPFLISSSSSDSPLPPLNEGPSPCGHASIPTKGPQEDREHLVGGLVSKEVTVDGNVGDAAEKEGLSRSSEERVTITNQWVHHWRRDVNRWLFVHAPSWYVADLTVGPTTAENTDTTSGSQRGYISRLSLRRRVKALHFAVTGGSDRRASYVEHTWGQRTPTLWFGDAWLPSLRPMTAAREHSKYKADPFGMLSFKMSRVWELIYRDYYCSGGGLGEERRARDATIKSLQNNGSELTSFDATVDPITYDEQVGDAFVALHPSLCTSVGEGTAFVKRVDRFGPRNLTIGISKRLLRHRGHNSHSASAGHGYASHSHSPHYSFIVDNNYDWFIRLWDDNYYFEENLFNIVGRIESDKAKVMVGKIGWRNMGKSAVYPFAGGGAGWFLSKAGMRAVGPSFAPPASIEGSDIAEPYAIDGFNPTLSGEEWFMAFRDRKDIFMKHGLHNEDVFLTAWFYLMNVTMWNVPGVEHVSPGMWPKQRCMSNLALFKLRWEGWAARQDNEVSTSAVASSVYTSLYYDYPVSDARFLLEGASYSYTKPLVWHYMSPTRLVGLEKALYAEALETQRCAEEKGHANGAKSSSAASTWAPIWGPPYLSLPKTASDKPPKARSRKKSCYAGVPQVTKSPASPNEWVRDVPPPGVSVFEELLRDPPLLSERDALSMLREPN